MSAGVLQNGPSCILKRMFRWFAFLLKLMLGITCSMVVPCMLNMVADGCPLHSCCWEISCLVKHCQSMVLLIISEACMALDLSRTQ